MAVVGRIGRPHGLRGDVVVNPETDFVDERFRVGAELRTRSDGGEETLTVATVRVQNGRPIVRFEGFSRIEEAERLAGLELRVREAELQALAPHTYYQHQLVGCAVQATDATPVGTVTRVDGGASGSLLVIDGPRGEILVPLTQEICVEVDVAAKRIRIDPPEGLLELNESQPPAAGSRRKRKRRS